MARRKAAVSSGPNNGYLVSFGDTMTALLAFFIVLNSLAEEQSGANLYVGTGSFVRALETFGLPGMFPGELSAQPFQMEQTSPQYLAPSEEQSESEPNPTGPDDVQSQQRVIDYEEESFHRFLNELDRLHPAAGEPPVLGEVVFDRLDRLPRAAPYLDAGLREMLTPIAPLLLRQDYAVEIVVWATTPNPTAWLRAADQAEALRQETLRYLQSTPQQASRVTAVGQPWISSTEKRPQLTLVVRRLQAPGRDSRFVR